MKLQFCASGNYGRKAVTLFKSIKSVYPHVGMHFDSVGCSPTECDRMEKLGVSVNRSPRGHRYYKAMRPSERKRYWRTITISRLLQETGQPVIYLHSDCLVLRRFDSIFGIDIAFEGVDMYELRDKLAPTKAIWTGPSSTYHLWGGPEPTRQAVRDVLDVFGPTGLILAPCVSSHSIMPWESTLAMIDEWKKLR